MATTLRVLVGAAEDAPIVEIALDDDDGNDNDDDDAADEVWETLKLQVLSVAGSSVDPPVEFNDVAFLDARGVLLANLAELRGALGRDGASGAATVPVRAVEGAGLQDFDAASAAASVCSFRLLAAAATTVAPASESAASASEPAHLPAVPFSSAVAGAGAELAVFPASAGAAHQAAHVVDLGPGPDKNAPDKRRPFGLVCQACAENCVVPGRAVAAPAASGPHLRFTCMTASLAETGRLGAAGAGMDVFEGLQPPPWATGASAAACRGAIRRRLLRTGTVLSDTAAMLDRSPERLAAFAGRLQGGVQTAAAYERPDLQEQARAVVPTAQIWAEAQAEVAARRARRRQERRDRRRGRVVVRVGASEVNEKVVALQRPGNRGPHSTVSVSAEPVNPQHPGWSDRFSVEVVQRGSSASGGAAASATGAGAGAAGAGGTVLEVRVRRTDSPHEGWGQDLQLMATWTEPGGGSGGAAAAAAPSPSPSLTPAEIPAKMRDLVAKFVSEDGLAPSAATVRAFQEIARLSAPAAAATTASTTLPASGGGAVSDSDSDAGSGSDEDADHGGGGGSSGGGCGERPWEADPESADLFLRHLLRWFKRDFFRWCNAPPCDRCGPAASADSVQGLGGGEPTEEELRWGARRVEVYKCHNCGNGNIRFPRFNHPGKLLCTRRGRCGEWANAFTLVCRALGFEARYVLDWTDHVWTEVWSAARGRWLHADSCEAALDRPLCYEAGWGKGLTYVVAFGRFGCADVGRRYSQHWPATLARRRAVPAQWLKDQLAELEAAGLRRAAAAGDSALQAARARAAADARDLAARGRPGGALSAEEQQGRASGSLAWRQARAEV